MPSNVPNRYSSWQSPDNHRNINATLLQKLFLFNIFATLLHKKEKMKSTKKSVLMAMIAMAMMAGCKKDEPVPVEDNENLTTVKLKFTESGITSIFTFKDLDGPGGNAPTIDKISLKPNKTYTLAIEILDETKKPVETISDAIYNERDEHLFEYVPTPASILSVITTDKDTRNLPIGLTASAKTTAVGTGKLQVVLHHQPPVNGKIVKTGAFTLGSIDFDGTFEVEVK